MDFVQPQASCNLRLSLLVQPLFLHMQMEVTHSTLSFFTRSGVLRSLLCGGLPKIHCCDELLHANLTPYLLHLHQNCEEVSSLVLVFCCGYGNFILHHIYVEIFDSDFRPIEHAAQSLENLSWNQSSSVNLWSKVSIIVIILQFTYVHTHDLSIKGSLIYPHEQISPACSCCNILYLIDDTIVEDTVPLLFVMYHRRWMTAPSLLILGFNRGDLLRLSSVKAIQNLQLNAHRTSSAYAGKTVGRVTRGASTGIEHKRGPWRLQLQQVQARAVAGQTTAV